MRKRRKIADKRDHYAAMIQGNRGVKRKPATDLTVDHVKKVKNWWKGECTDSPLDRMISLHIDMLIGVNEMNNVIESVDNMRSLHVASEEVLHSHQKAWDLLNWVTEQMFEEPTVRTHEICMLQTRKQKPMSMIVHNVSDTRSSNPHNLPVMWEIYSGSCSVSSSFKRNGWIVCAIDTNMDLAKATGATHANTLHFDHSKWVKRYGTPTFIWFSPPCRWLSYQQLPHKRNVCLALTHILHCLRMIRAFKPKFYVIESPRNLLVKMECMRELSYVDCDLCMYQNPFQKPSRYYTTLEYSLLSCTHESHEITLGRTYRGMRRLVNHPAIKGKIPEKLALEIATQTVLATARLNEGDKMIQNLSEKGQREVAATIADVQRAYQRHRQPNTGTRSPIIMPPTNTTANANAVSEPDTDTEQPRSQQPSIKRSVQYAKIQGVIEWPLCLDTGASMTTVTRGTVNAWKKRISIRDKCLTRSYTGPREKVLKHPYDATLATGQTITVTRHITHLDMTLVAWSGAQVTLRSVTAQIVEGPCAKILLGTPELTRGLQILPMSVQYELALNKMDTAKISHSANARETQKQD